MPQPRSRCTVAAEPPHSWNEHVDDAHPEVRIFAEWLLSLKPFAMNHLLGELEGLKDEAAAGLLQHGLPDSTTRIKPIRDRPEVWELRWKMYSKQVRQYHGEPSDLPTMLVALHMHIKTSKKHQDGQIDVAARRYDAENWRQATP